MEMEIEEIKQKHEQKKAEKYIDYLSRMFNQPLQEKPSRKYLDAKREFEQMLMPNQKAKTISEELKWDKEVEELKQKYIKEGRNID